MAGETHRAWLLPPPHIGIGSRVLARQRGVGVDVRGAGEQRMEQTALSESLRGVEAEIAARHPERALTLSQDVQARYPRALAVQRVTGEVYLALRKTREAIGALDRALAGDPEDARACCARAIVQQIQGDSMGALAWYRRACDIRPGDKVLLAAYRELARSLNQPTYEPSRTGLARLYLRGGLLAHAIREWESILAERPDALDAQLGLAETLWVAHNTQAAADRCRRVLLNSPFCVKAMLILAAIEHDAGNDDEARNHLRRAAELDPDMRIARELFADRLAANDRALSLLVFGEEPLTSRVPSVPLAQQAGTPAPATTARPSTGSLTGAPGLPGDARSGVPSQPAARIDTGALTQPQPAQPPQGARTTGALPPAAYTTSAPAARSNDLPPDFHRIFSETKDMLWHDDVEGQETQARMPGVAAFDRSRADPFARSQAVMPPALLGAGGSLEDTETRLSINFLNWLQAQGALAQNAAMHGMPGTTGPVPVPLPPRQRPGGEEAGATGPLPTGPLPPPTPEALKAMFAELEPETASRRIVDADIVSARDETDWNAQTDALGAAASASATSAEPAPNWSAGAASNLEDVVTDELFSPHFQAPGIGIEDISTGELSGPLMPPIEDQPAASEDTPSWSAWQNSTGETAVPASSEWLGFAIPAEAATEASPMDARFSGFAPTGDEFPAESATAESVSASTGEAQSPAPSAAPTTLEALEQSFAQSGFETFELRPGELAAIAEGMPPAQSEEQPSAPASGMFASSDTSDPLDASAPSVMTVSREPEQARASAAPTLAPDDYAGRLYLARERRAAGNLDEALGEYRIILKNAPDLFGDVMDELNESLAVAPDHPELHRLLGDAHIRQGDYLSALESYNRAVALTQAQDN